MSNPLRGGFTPAPEEQLGMTPTEAAGQGVQPANQPEAGPDPTAGDVGQEAGPPWGTPRAISSIPQPPRPIRRGAEPYAGIGGLGVAPSPEQLPEGFGWQQAWLDRQPPAASSSGPGDIDAAYDSMVPTWSPAWPGSAYASRPANPGLDAEPDGD